jgi:HTH-type transcriptional regulator / antitoxin HipB
MSERRWARPLTATDLGRYLAEVRVARGLTQEEVADALGISRRYVYEIESGKPGLFTHRLFALLRLLGVRATLETDVSPVDDVPREDGVGTESP